jgi:ketol-acid reductoisomerase
VTPAATYQEHDARPELLNGLCVAIYGYGNQGHAHALNLRDSGVDVVVAAREGGTGEAAARSAGFTVLTFAQAAARADILMLTLPDEIQAEVFQRDIEKNWRDSAVLAFPHGFALAFGQIELAPTRRAFLVAPKGQGHKLRQAYVAGGGLPGLLATTGPDPEATLELALAYAHACGALKGGGFLSSFREEAVTDQFGEQVVLCGGLEELIVAAWETLVDRGYSREVAYFECLHEVKLIVDLIAEHGIDGMRSRISSTAAYGGLQAARRVIGPESRREMAEILDEIEDGRFAKSFLRAQGGTDLSAAIEAEASHGIVGTGRQLREFLQACRLSATETDEKGSDT